MCTFRASILHRFRKSCVPSKRRAASRMAARSSPGESPACVTKKYLYARYSQSNRAEKVSCT